MVKRSELAELLNVSKAVIVRLIDKLEIVEYKTSNSYYITDEDAARIKDYVAKNEPKIVKKAKYTDPLKDRLHYLEGCFLENPHDMELLSQLNQTRLKYKQRHGDSNLTCISVNDRGLIK